ncbi:MAG: SOS response-associated peptidase family protein [Dokdonella sp.]
MCFSAQVWESYALYVRKHGADVDIHAFYQLYFARSQGAPSKIPKAMDANFATATDGESRQIRTLIDTHDRALATRYEQEVFKQRKRLADAERVLQVRTTRKALDDQRIATDKVGWLLGKLADLRRTQPKPSDSRIFPGHYAPVMIRENGRRVVKPMRYQCRPAGKPASHDRRYPGTYNARRDNLERFWKGQFGHTHGIMVINAFYENVSRHALEQRDLREGEAEENVVLEFRPRPEQDMLVACLWSKWQGEDEPDLLSFAAITDEPPAEVAAAGHDRCIIPISEQNIDAWLNPQSHSLADLDAILDARARPFFEHRMAA